jgi:hypothetical protein
MMEPLGPPLNLAKLLQRVQRREDEGLRQRRGDLRQFGTNVFQDGDEFFRRNRPYLDQIVGHRYNMRASERQRQDAIYRT